MPLSLWEDENHIYVEADTPGLTDKDIDVSVHDNQLVIRGERKHEQKGNGYDTRSYGRFEQTVTLPVEVDSDAVEAKLTNGVLSLSFPKSSCRVWSCGAQLPPRRNHGRPRYSGACPS